MNIIYVSTAYMVYTDWSNITHLDLTGYVNHYEKSWWKMLSPIAMLIK